MYIFAKFVPDHIFLQNRDKLNIKKFVNQSGSLSGGSGKRIAQEIGNARN
jgi:hypothetical protein